MYYPSITHILYPLFRCVFQMRRRRTRIGCPSTVTTCTRSTQVCRSPGPARSRGTTMVEVAAAAAQEEDLWTPAPPAVTPPAPGCRQTWKAYRLEEEALTLRATSRAVTRPQRDRRLNAGAAQVNRSCIPLYRSWTKKGRTLGLLLIICQVIPKICIKALLIKILIITL